MKIKIKFMFKLYGIRSVRYPIVKDGAPLNDMGFSMLLWKLCAAIGISITVSIQVLGQRAVQIRLKRGFV